MKQFTPTQEMIDAAGTVFLAMAHEQTIRPIVEGYQRDILARHQFRVKPEFAERRGDEVITDPKLAYLMSDDDFTVYLAECKQARDTAKLHVDDDDYCPLLVAQDLQTQAEHALIDAMEPLTQVTLDKLLCSRNGLDNLKKYLDLSLKLLASFVDSEKVLPKIAA